MKLDLDRQLIRQIRKLANTECANSIGGQCIYDCPCTVINPRYPTIHDGAVDCDYFLEAVLPIDPELCRNVWKELFREEETEQTAMKKCVICGRPFVPNSNRQQYCSGCKPLHERNRNRDKQRQYYYRKQAKESDCYRLESQQA